MINLRQFLFSLFMAVITTFLGLILVLTQHFSTWLPLLQSFWLMTTTYWLSPVVIVGGIILYFTACYYVVLRMISFVIRYL